MTYQIAGKDIAEALIARARALAPIVAERASGAEAARRLPSETHAAFRDAGFYRVLQPGAFGGLEMEYGTHTELAAEVARGCPSSGWAVGVTASHGWIFGMFPPEAQAEFWETDPQAIIATSFMPTSFKVAREGDGFRIEGRWSFSSNVDHCAAALLLLPVPRENGPPDTYFMFVPAADYRVDDVWHAAGLMATGSNDIVVPGCFVPAHRTLLLAETANGQTPGGRFHKSPLYRMPLFCTFGHTLIGTALGAVAGALDAIVEDLATRASTAKVRLREQQAVQLRVAEANAELDAAWALVRQDRALINARARADSLPDPGARTTYRLHLGYAAKLCVQAMERLYPLGGARGMDAGNPVQRAWRDVHAVANHIGLVWDLQAANFGAVRLGLPCPDPRL